MLIEGQGFVQFTPKLVSFSKGLVRHRKSIRDATVPGRVPGGIVDHSPRPVLGRFGFAPIHGFVPLVLCSAICISVFFPPPREEKYFEGKKSDQKQQDYGPSQNDCCTSAATSSFGPHTTLHVLPLRFIAVKRLLVKPERGAGLATTRPPQLRVDYPKS